MSSGSDDAHADIRLDLHPHLNLPADAPDGHLHIIDVKAISEELNDLTAVDAIATVLYKWDPKALENLLNFTNTDVFWGYAADDHETYIRRTGREVCVGKIELGERWPDLEVEYHTDSNGCWDIIGGQDSATIFGHCHFLTAKGRQRQPAPNQAALYQTALNDVQNDEEACKENDQKFAKDMITGKMWMRGSKTEGFRYEVNGVNMMGAPGYEADLEYPIGVDG